MAEYLIQDTTLINIANAIRAKEGTTGSISPNDFATRIKAVQTGPKLDNIVITKQPTKINYTAKESFNPAGMEVKAVFSNSAYKFATDFTVEPSGALKPTDTTVKIKYTEFGVTAEAEVPITVATIGLNTPMQSDSPVYTGSTITPAWTGYDSSLMDISGDTSGTNAGSYTAKFSLKDKVNYTWADGTTSDKSVAWSIGKAQASITLDKSSVVLNGDKLSETVTFSSVGMTSVIAMSSDPSVASITMDGNIITISSVNETTGTANIIISGEVNSNYNAPEYPTIAVSAEFVKIVEMILRPTSAGGTVSPSGMSAVEAISEEITDDSTYIYGTVKAASGTSSPMSYTTLNVAFNEIEFAGKLISAYMIVRRGKKGVSIQSESAYASAMMVANGGAAGTILPDTAANGYTDYQYTFGDTAIASINEYIIANGKLPSFVWQGQFGHNNPGGSMTVKVSQAYVVLIYEEPKEITFTINGTQYSAYETMTWNKWNNSDFNTTGQKVVSVTNASGDSVSLDSVIVGGTAYEVGFAPPAATVTLIFTFLNSSANNDVATATINGTTYKKAYGDSDNDGNGMVDTVSLLLPIGTEIELVSKRTNSSYGNNYIELNGNTIDSYKSNIAYTHKVTKDAVIALNLWYGSIGPSMYGSCGRIEITEQ